MSAKKLKAGEGDWTCVKEVLGRIINTESGTVSPPKQKLQELKQMFSILSTQQHANVLSVRIWSA